MKQTIICVKCKRRVIAMVIFCLAIKGSAQIDSTANLPQFLFPEFTKSVVKLRTGVSITAFMNYNTLTERMSFYQNGALQDLDKPETVDTVFIQKSKFVFFDPAFYEVLVNAPISLYIQHKSNLTSTGSPAGYGTTSQTVGPTSVSKIYGISRSYDLKVPDGFKVTPSPVYWVRMNNVMNSFQTERQFLNNFPEQKEEIKQFIKQSGIRINKTEDLIILVSYCNQLLQ